MEMYLQESQLRHCMERLKQEGYLNMMDSNIGTQWDSHQVLWPLNLVEKLKNLYLIGSKKTTHKNISSGGKPKIQKGCH